MTTYTATRSMQNPKTAFIVTMLLVFLVGAVAGALVMNFDAHKGLHRRTALLGDLPQVL